MSIKGGLPTKEWLDQKIALSNVRQVAEEFARNLDTGEHWNALVEGFMAGAAWAEEVRSSMTMEEAVELGESDNEANWDNPVRLAAYRIRMGIAPAEGG